MPGRLPKEDARLALIGASYHLHQLEAQFSSGLSDDEQVMLFHWHLRGFFWEVVAVRDSMRHEPKTNSAIWAALRALEGAQWFQEVNKYRNFAHESFHVVEVVHLATGRARAFQMQLKPGDGLRHLRDYWNEMEQFFKAIYP